MLRNPVDHVGMHVTVGKFVPSSKSSFFKSYLELQLSS